VVYDKHLYDPLSVVVVNIVLYIKFHNNRYSEDHGFDTGSGQIKYNQNIYHTKKKTFMQIIYIYIYISFFC